MRVQTADKNITIIHTTPVHQLMSLWSNKMHVYKSPLSIILVSPVKKQSYLYEERYINRSNTIYQQNEDNRDGRFHWRKCWYGLWTRIWQLFTSQDVNWWTEVVWIIVMSLSAVWTLILTAPIHCRGLWCDVMLHFSKSVPMKKQIHLHLG